MFSLKLNLSDLIQKLNSVGDLTHDIADAVATEAVQPELAKEPFRTSHPKMIFVSAKQRAFVMAGIRSGALQVPYVRTGQVGITEKHQTSNGVDVVVPAPYSDLVRTKGMQAKYHEKLWEDTDAMSERLESTIVESVAEAAVIKALDKAGLT